MPVHMLVVDDEENIRAALQRWFEASGFTVDAAPDGADAVQMCSVTPYDIVTMDLEMPRMDGIDAIAAIRRVRPGVPIVVLTGFLGRAEEALRHGATKILAKPLSLRKLEEEVRAILSEAQSSPASGTDTA